MWPVTDAAGNLREPVLLWRAVCRALDDGFASWSRSRRTPCSRPTSSALAQDDRPGAVVPSIRRDLPGRAAMLEALGLLHVLGRDVRFEALHAGARRVVPLPAHPWRSERFELPRLERAGAAARSEARDDWLYEVDWKLEPPPPAPAEPGAGNWLLLGGDGPLEAAVREALAAAGRTVVAPGTPDLGPDDLRRILLDLAARGVLPLEGVLDLRDRGAESGPVDLVRLVQATRRHADASCRYGIGRRATSVA